MYRELWLLMMVIGAQIYIISIILRFAFSEPATWWIGIIIGLCIFYSGCLMKEKGGK